MNFRRFLLVSLMLGITSISFANDSYAKKNSITVSFSNPKIVEEKFWFEKGTVNIHLAYNRNIREFLSIGSYAGVGIFEEWECIKNGNSVSSSYLKYSTSLHYGANSKIHFLPFILKDGTPRFDLYISGSAGIITLGTTVAENIVPSKGNYFNYSLMGGVTFYLSKKFGLYSEAGYQNYKYFKGFNARYGLSFRF